MGLLEEQKLPAIVLFAALVLGIVYAGYVKTEQEKMAYVIQRRCLALVSMPESETYAEPKYHQGKTASAYSQNIGLMSGLDRFVACIKNDVAYAKWRPVNRYVTNAEKGRAFVSIANSATHMYLCSGDSPDYDFMRVGFNIPAFSEESITECPTELSGIMGSFCRSELRRVLNDPVKRTKASSQERYDAALVVRNAWCVDNRPSQE